MADRKVKSARAEVETEAETAAAFFIKTVIERNTKAAQAAAALSAKAMAGRKVGAEPEAIRAARKVKAKATRGAAGLAALARVGGKDGRAAVREVLIAALRAQHDPLLLGLADLMDKKVNTELTIEIVLGWTGHDKPARDVEIAARVEMKVRDGMKQIAAFGDVAMIYGISGSRAEKIWRKHHKKFSEDEAFLSNAARWGT